MISIWNSEKYGTAKSEVMVGKMVSETLSQSSEPTNLLV